MRHGRALTPLLCVKYKITVSAKRSQAIKSSTLEGSDVCLRRFQGSVRDILPGTQVTHCRRNNTAFVITVPKPRPLTVQNYSRSSASRSFDTHDELALDTDARE